MLVMFTVAAGSRSLARSALIWSNLAKLAGALMVNRVCGRFS